MTEKTNIPCGIGEKEYLKPEEATAWVGICNNTLYEWERQGMKALKIGKNKFYSKKHIREFMERVDHIV